MITLLKTILYYPFVNLLVFYVWLIPGHNIFWGVLLLTVTVRLILLVPTKRQAQSQRKTMQLAPLIEDLKKEYGEDRQGLAAAQMDLYKKNNINPVGSCLLAVIQLPILLILYYAILHGLHGDSTHLYSWLPKPKVINSNFFGINLFEPDHTYILPFLAALLQFVQVRLTLPKFPPGTKVDATVSMQRNMSFIFPLVTLLIAYRFPAAVALYWIISTGFTAGQQYFVNKEKFNIQDVKEVMQIADSQHPEFHRSKKEEATFLEETSVSTKKGVTVTVRQKKK